MAEPSSRISRQGAALRPEEAARYSRQIMLPEVGRDGQLAIVAATAAVGGSAVAERYATRVGFAATAPGQTHTDELAPVELVRDEAAREVLAGARAALNAVRRTLERGTTP